MVGRKKNRRKRMELWEVRKRINQRDMEEKKEGEGDV